VSRAGSSTALPQGTAAEAIPQASSTPPSSSLFTVAGPVRGRVKGVPWLLRRFLRELIPAAGAQAIVPAIPAPELLVTAQTRDASSIPGVVRSPAMVGLAGSFSTHGGPQRCADGVDGARTRQGSPPRVGHSTDEDWRTCSPPPHRCGDGPRQSAIILSWSVECEHGALRHTRHDGRARLTKQGRGRIRPYRAPSFCI
jgi:hypothetical protein